MKTLLACLLLLSLPAHADSDNYISFDEGEIVLFALPGCQAHGKKGLYGFAKWINGESEIICWNYDEVIRVHLVRTPRTIIFDPDDVQTRGVNTGRSPSYG